MPETVREIAYRIADKAFNSLGDESEAIEKELLAAEKRGYELARQEWATEYARVAEKRGAEWMRERAAKFAENRKGGSGATGSGIYAELEILRFQEEALQIVADEIRALPLEEGSK